MGIKKKLKRAYIIIFACILLFVPIVYGSMLLIENVPISNSDLGDININGFYINQIVDLKDDSKYHFLRETDGCKIYEVIDSNKIQLTISNEGNRIIMVHAYHDEEIEDTSLITPSIEDILVDTSTINEVVGIFGKKYNKLLFSDAYGKVITYKDLNKKLKLHFCFNEDILVAIILK